MRRHLSTYAAPPQDTSRGEGYQEFMGAVCQKRSGLPDIGVCVQGDLKVAIYGQARQVLETTSFD
jgi:hypothetical protein